jgi:predicted esterase
MKVTRTEEEIIIHPENHKRTLIWLHGFASSGEMYLDDFLKTPPLPDCKIIMPTAKPKSIPSLPGQLHSAWYARLGFTYHDSIEESVQRINLIIEKELGLTSQLILGGFSQGAVLALMCGLSRYPGKIDAIIAFSGFAMPMSIPSYKRNIPVLTYHGLKDPLIPWSKAISTYRLYLIHCNSEVFLDDETGHDINERGIIYARNWLNQRLSLD